MEYPAVSLKSDVALTSDPVLGGRWRIVHLVVNFIKSTSSYELVNMERGLKLASIASDHVM